MPPKRITLVPHTHWDREWYRPFEAFRKRLVGMMDALLDLLDDGLPHFHLDGQSAMIDDYLAVRPEREADVRRLASEGRISVGPWFTQMDEFLCSGESHVRNLERGLARARDFRASLPPVGYLPDQFGHVGQMPQILAQAGVDRAVVWRGVPAEIDRTAFWWEAPDGTGVLAEYLVYGYSLGAALRESPDEEHLGRALARAVEILEPVSAREDRYLILAGGDHHGPDPELPVKLAAARQSVPDLDARIGPIADHVSETLSGEVPVWRGELRSSARAYLLAGVASTRIHQKRERARVEALVERYAEPLAALVPRFRWPGRDLDRIWQLLLWNGAHDSVCGCSIDAVARAVDARHAEARALAERIVGRALASLGRRVEARGTIRFNPSPFERDGLPGLGWEVRPGIGPRPGRGAEITVRGKVIEVEGFELTLLDEPDVGDLYNFCPDGEPSPPRALRLTGPTVKAEFAGSNVSLRFGHSTGVKQLRVFVAIHNERPDHRLRLLVSLPHPTERVIAGSPFQLVERGLTSEGAPFEPPSPTWPARGVVQASGVAVLAEGVIEYEVVDGRALAVTLLRCVGTISRPGFATRGGPAGPDIATPEAQMVGSTELSLGLLSPAVDDDLMPAWEEFALPIMEGPATGGGNLPARGALLEVEGGALSSVRRRGRTLEVRVWNPGHAPAEAFVGGRRVHLSPARIATVSLRRAATSRPRPRRH